MTALLLLFAASVQHGLRVPDGFEVTLYADHTLANDIHCMTVGPDGQVIVSGRGYVRRLVGAEKAEKALEFAAAPKDGAMGLFWEKGDLYVVGDGGLKVYRDADDAGRTKPPHLLFRCKTGGEHTSHAVQRGPDGWMYLIVGDGAGITAKDVTGPLSPIKGDPVGGCVLRFSPDWKQVEVVAHGFRNAYGMDFGSDGELYTFDSDNERCVCLPWYEHTRFYRVQVGGHHGWLGPKKAATWRMPPHFPDVVPPVATLGRGSPTGVAMYRHAQFPARYRGGAFLCDWTFGQVHFVALKKKGSCYEGTPEVFLKAMGEEGFAPVAAAVHPKTGDLYVAIGGRGTRGAVYRIRHTAGSKSLDPAEVKRWQPAARSLEHTAYLDMQRRPDVLITDPHFHRRVMELAVRHEARIPAAERLQLLKDHAETRDRALLQLAARLARGLDRREVVNTLNDSDTLIPSMAFPGEEEAVRLLKRPRGDDYLAGVRAVQRYLDGPPGTMVRGTVWEGYTRAKGKALSRIDRAVFRAAIPSKNDLLDFEMARTLAMIEDDDFLVTAKVLAKLGNEKKPSDDVHYLICLARLKGKLPADAAGTIATTLLSLEINFDKLRMKRDSNWPPRIAELHAKLAEREPGLNAVLVASPLFGHPGHVILTRAKGIDRSKAALRFLEKAKDDAFAWNAELVRLVAELPAEKSLPVLRGLWGKAGVDDELLPVLARHATKDDHEKLLGGLTSARLALVGASLAGIEKLPAEKSEVVPLLRSLRQLPAGKEEDALRKRLLARLEKVTDHREPTLEAWLGWARKAYPDQAAALNNLDGVDVDAWKKRLGKIAWDRGDATRGAAVFVKASCASCHSGAAALGPDLAGVTKRFSRDDLLTAIVQPSKDVSPRYRTTRITTDRGVIHQGIVVYEAVDGVILQTGPASTIRLSGKQVAGKGLSPMSLMPAGLLDRLSDAEIADLLAYLAAPAMRVP